MTRYHSPYSSLHTCGHNPTQLVKQPPEARLTYPVDFRSSMESDNQLRKPPQSTSPICCVPVGTSLIIHHTKIRFGHQGRRAWTPQRCMEGRMNNRHGHMHASPTVRIGIRATSNTCPAQERDAHDKERNVKQETNRERRCVVSRYRQVRGNRALW